MAPFITHFLVAEQIWPDLDGPWHNHYGQFCFGCVSPDVDKLSDTLTQKDTHFFDRHTDYDLMTTHRSISFIEHQATFLEQPFVELPPAGQAFVLGYLCHLCVDEVSKHLWRRETTWSKFYGLTPLSAFAALDGAALQHIANYGVIQREIQALRPIKAIRPISEADLNAMFRGICNFVQKRTVEEQFLAVIDMFDQPSAAERQTKLAQFRQDIEIARPQIAFFQLEQFVAAAVRHSRRRSQDFLSGHVPQAAYPFS